MPDTPESRRELRERERAERERAERAAAESARAEPEPTEREPADGFAELLGMDDTPDTGHRRKRRRPLLKSARLWVPVGIVVVVLGVVVVGALLVPKALTARSELEAAIPLAKQVEAGMLSGNTASAQSAAKTMQQHTSKAASATDGILWRSVEWVPVIGANLHAVRVAADSANTVAANAAVPASALSLDSFKPQNGRINVEAISKVTNTVNGAAKAVDAAQADLRTVDTSGLIGPVKSGVQQLSSALDSLAPQLRGVQTAVKVLPTALGEHGTKHYLMLFENNAETRGWAGNPAALLLVTVTDGAISIDAQASSSDFDNGLAQPIVALDPSMEALYGSKIGRYMQDTTTPADFPTTARLISAFWKQHSSTPIDGVMSFDPVALSYLLKATGPIKLSTGDVLTSDNAVQLLLSQVYFRYSDPKMQDAFFAAAAASVFDTVEKGNLQTMPMLTALSQAVTEHRLLFWSADAAEQKLIAPTALAGTLPATNAKTTGVGVFLNDTTAAKLDYYLYPSVTVTSNRCTASKPTLTSTVVLDDKTPANAVSTLPSYVIGVFYNGRTAIDVTLYGTVGGTMSDYKVNGQAVKPTYTGQNLGRPVAKISVLLSPGEKLSVSYTMTGGSGSHGPLSVYTTALAHPTPVTLTTPGCGADGKSSK
ncbi:DUF4012 domain-containing protein [Humibacter ginsenosidimutans]|uniref:DUF4012 domain-containing protein n=1 Tax=Humibacter ginsenosidimutans TaxID=2599293 RepID=A0A5B8M5X5_9MICO|nr:DUF4012 domain-containing protein [Humibacter ginsenosidimutans]QDZ15002.1 DUF4012 domain-containing protein [Humibacter ginsenosidimutans]